MADERIPFDPSGFCTKHGRQVLALQDKGHFTEAATALRGAFVWEESPEGHEFWHAEYEWLRDGTAMAAGAREALLAHINTAEAEAEGLKE